MNKLIIASLGVLAVATFAVVGCRKSPTTPSAQNALAALGVTLTLPSGWNVQPSPDPMFANISNVLTLSPVDASSSAMESLFQVLLLRNANPSKLTVDQWFDQYFVNGFDGPILSRTSITVGGRPALRLEASGMGTWAHLYVPVDSDVIAVSYEVSKPAFIAQYEAMLGSMQFLR